MVYIKNEEKTNMIAYLSGKPLVSHNELIIQVQGVGYGVHVGAQTLTACTGRESLEMYVHTFVKEDEISLYGFLSFEEKEMFLQLLSVSGVGPKTALTIIDKGTVGIYSAVHNGDVTYFSSIPRIGKKLSQKIIIELRSKLGNREVLDLQRPTEKYSQVSDALLSLGFGEHDIQEV